MSAPISTSINTANMQNIILQNLLEKPSYNRTVVPYLKYDYFNDYESQTIFNQIQTYMSKYDSIPTKKEVVVSIKENPKLSDEIKASTLNRFKEIYTSTEPINNYTFLLDNTQTFIQQAEFKTHILAGATAIREQTDMTDVVYALEQALKISFDTEIGTSFDDLEKTLTWIKRDVAYIPTGVSTLDDILGGGFEAQGTLNIIGGASHSGKSAMMVSLAASMYLSSKKNVLYVSLEMSEENILKRLYANIFDTDINTFRSTDNEYFAQKYKDVKKTNPDNYLMVKEFPTGTLTTNQLIGYLDKLEAKLGKLPDVIFVDYIQIMRPNNASITDSFTMYKNVAEELRAVAMKYKICLVSGVQLNRSGYGNADAGMDSVAGSLGIAATADYMGIIIRDKTMDANSQIMFKSVKNRNTGNLSDIVIGIEYDKMRYYGLDGGSSYTSNTPKEAQSFMGDFNMTGVVPNSTVKDEIKIEDITNAINQLATPIMPPPLPLTTPTPSTNIYGADIQFDFG